MLSRNDLTFKYTETASQGSNALGAPSMKMNEYSALYNLSGNTVKAYKDMMDAKSGTALTNWKQAMVYYKATGDEKYLTIAKQGGQIYRRTSFGLRRRFYGRIDQLVAFLLPRIHRAL